MLEKRIMFHAHIGMNDMDSTASALAGIHEQLSGRGFILDRAGYALDRRMGLPEEKRAAEEAKAAGE